MIKRHPSLAGGLHTSSLLLALIALTVQLFAGPVYAVNLYVSGYREIMLRAGPSGQHKILAVLKTGDEMKRLGAKGDYYRVSLPDGRKGYVLKTFVENKPPPQFSVKKLEQQLRSQTEQLEALRRENAQLKETSGKFEKDASSQGERLRQLEQERAELRRNDNVWWFLAGAGVLLVGWLLGWTRLRLGRRTRRSGFG